MSEATKFFGTAFLVDRTWYVRSEGGRGVLLPIDAPTQLTESLADGCAYEFEGSIVVDGRGCAVGAKATVVRAVS